MRPIFAAPAAALAAAALLVFLTRPRATPHAAVAAPAASLDADTVLRNAALERFKNGVVHLTYGATEVTPDPALADDVKVNLFKRTLSKEEQARDPAFRAKAEDTVRLRMPANARITWEDLSGNQELDFLIDDTQACASLVGGAEKSIAARDLAKAGCIKMPLVQNRWDDDASLKVKLEPVEEDDPAWERLVQHTMAELAASEFVASARAPQ